VCHPVIYERLSLTPATAVLLLNVLTKPLPMLEIPILSSRYVLFPFHVKKGVFKLLLSCILVVQGVSCCRIVLGLLRYAHKSEQYAASGADTKLGTTSESVNFFTIPTGIYDKDLLEEWEYALAVQEVNDSVDSQSIEFSLTAVDTASQEV
jgi:hypothetical protein